MRTILTKRGKGHKMKAKAFTDDICSNFTLRQGTAGEIPERLLTARRFIDSRIGRVLIMDLDQERVIGAEHKLAPDFKVTMCQCISERCKVGVIHFN